MSWTNIPKPNTQTYTKVSKPTHQITVTRGTATGLLMPPTYSKIYNLGNTWTNIKAAVGANLVVNGSFNGNANSWILGTNWAYGSNNIIHSNGSGAQAYQSVGADNPLGDYIISAQVGGTIGTVILGLGTANSNIDGQTFDAGIGLIEFTTGGGGHGDFALIPSADFDGFITNVSVTAILNNWNYL